jgi:3'-phosphoadenosine 5'-phosphosulfate sulfotransferase (PAPS reductase)/FAD synthetase
MTVAVDATSLLLFRSRAFQLRLHRALAVVGDAIGKARRPYVAISSGKDSLVVMALALAVCPDIALAWSDDELEYPETVDWFAELRAKAGPQLLVTLGWTEHARWFLPWRAEPPFREPFDGSVRIEMRQDDWMAGLGHDLTLLGTRMGESRRRRDWLLAHGPTYRVSAGTGLRCCPIYDWSADEVWALIAGWGLVYNRAYDTLAVLGAHRSRQRIGPLPLARRDDLAVGWPDLLARLEARYGRRWG